MDFISGMATYILHFLIMGLDTIEEGEIAKFSTNEIAALNFTK